MMKFDIKKTRYIAVSYTLIDALGGASRLFDLDMDGSLFNRKQLTNDLEEQVSPFLSSILGRIVFTQNNKLKNYSLLSIKLCNLWQRVVARIPLYFNLLCLSSNIIKRISILRRKTQKKATARAQRNVRTILPYKRLAKVLQILRSENTPETWRSAGQTLNSALNFPVWKLGKVFLSLIRLGINTDSLHIAYISHNPGSVHRSLPFFQFLTIIKKQHEH